MKRSSPKRYVSHERGQRSETLACQALQQAGYRIIERNYKTPRFEIDIVAQQRGVLVFVEVRARSAGSMVHPLESIDRRKMQRMVLGARHYMARHGRLGAPARFDVVSVEWRGTAYRLQIIRDAFRLDS